MKAISLAILLAGFASNALASWYGCAPYESEELVSMQLAELRELRRKNSELAEEIYEDAAVQSVLDKRLSDFRYMQYRECVEHIMIIDGVIDTKLSGSASIELP